MEEIKMALNGKKMFEKLAKDGMEYPAKFKEIAEEIFGKIEKEQEKFLKNLKDERIKEFRMDSLS